MRRSLKKILLFVVILSSVIFSYMDFNKIHELNDLYSWFIIVCISFIGGILSVLIFDGAIKDEKYRAGIVDVMAKYAGGLARNVFMLCFGLMIIAIIIFRMDDYRFFVIYFAFGVSFYGYFLFYKFSSKH